MMETMASNGIKDPSLKERTSSLALAQLDLKQASSRNFKTRMCLSQLAVLTQGKEASPSDKLAKLPDCVRTRRRGKFPFDVFCPAGLGTKKRSAVLTRKHPLPETSHREDSSRAPEVPFVRCLQQPLSWLSARRGVVLNTPDPCPSQSQSQSQSRSSGLPLHYSPSNSSLGHCQRRLPELPESATQRLAQLPPAPFSGRMASLKETASVSRPLSRNTILQGMHSCKCIMPEEDKEPWATSRPKLRLPFPPLGAPRVRVQKSNLDLLFPLKPPTFSSTSKFILNQLAPRAPQHKDRTPQDLRIPPDSGTKLNGRPSAMRDLLDIFANAKAREGGSDSLLPSQHCSRKETRSVLMSTPSTFLPSKQHPKAPLASSGWVGKGECLQGINPFVERAEDDMESHTLDTPATGGENEILDITFGTADSTRDKAK